MPPQIPFSHAEALPPEPAFLPCQACGALVQDRAWVHGTKDTPPHWKTLGLGRSPITGNPHACEPSFQREEDTNAHR